MNIPDERIEKALRFLTETDEAYGELKGRKAGIEHRLKVCKAVESLKSGGKSMAECEALALSSEPYQAMVNDYEGVCIDLETIGAKRKKEELVIEVWRSVGANRRSGQI